MRIISVSRRTDVPAYYGEWFANRLRDGWVGVVHPYIRRAVRVSLKPEDVYAFVFWSKNFEPFLPVLDLVDEMGYQPYFMFTITGMGNTMEPNVPPAEDMIRAFRYLAERYSPKHVQWRFDPILITDQFFLQLYLAVFSILLRELEGSTERCFVSFANRYPKAARRVETAGHRWVEPAPDAKRALVAALARVARAHGVQLYTCCSPDLLVEGVLPGRCVDYEHLAQVFGHADCVPKLAPTKKGCGCSESLDIGAYGTCAHGCLYCYANQDYGAAQRFHATHDPGAPSLAAKWEKVHSQSVFGF